MKTKVRVGEPVHILTVPLHLPASLDIMARDHAKMILSHFGVDQNKELKCHDPDCEARHSAIDWLSRSLLTGMKFVYKMGGEDAMEAMPGQLGAGLSKVSPEAFGQIESVVARDEGKLQ